MFSQGVVILAGLVFFAEPSRFSPDVPLDRCADTLKGQFFEYL